MLTNWVIADLDSPEGRLLAYEAIKQMVRETSSQILTFLSTITR